MRILSALARWRENADEPAPVANAVFAHAVGQPLLVEPAMGERLLSAYLHGGIEAPRPLFGSYDTDAIQRGMSTPAVLDISGPLVNRPQPGLCDDGPLSYQAIREAFDVALADDQCSAIVLQIESPGGMVAGCFDLADHIHRSRGRKPVIAVADDFAFSGAYALAAACDTIWVSRTSGVGSIGVMTYHLDRTGANAKAGFKVTPIYAGAHKIDFSPHRALSDDAAARAQKDVNQLHTLFVDSVARYRQQSATKIRKTEALTYMGQAAIDAGLADRLGTMREALASLPQSKRATPASKPKAAASASPAPPKTTAAADPYAVYDRLNAQAARHRVKDIQRFKACE